jgi:hypothetical protein
METQNAAAAGIGGGVMLVWLVVFVVMIVACWKVFTKAGQPGWASIIPFYNIYVLLTIVGRPGWWLLLFFIPIVNLVIGIIVTIDLATRFGKGGGYAAGLILLPIVFYPMLAFGSAAYTPAPTSQPVAQ